MTVTVFIAFRHLPNLTETIECKNIKKYEIKQEIRVFILNFGDYCLFYAVLDYSSSFSALRKSKGVCIYKKYVALHQKSVLKCA